MATTREYYASVIKVLSEFWRAYGGFPALVRSPYLHLSFILALISSAEWGKAWWELVISVLPGLIGFTLGGYAILIAFGDEKFRSIITGASQDGRTSPFVVISAIFMHFILTQIMALLYAILVRQICSPLVECAGQGAMCSIDFAGSEYVLQVVGFIGIWAFYYAIALAFSATLAIFQISLWYDASKGGDGE